ncbi:MAG: FtsX-like permease family protein, partial [Fulvivirga sp.]
LGLFGLASYMTEQRKRETGVRKVFGASIWQLTNLFSKQFLRLVLISFIISTPVAYYLTENWLQRFAYRIDSSIIPFAISGVVALLIAFITVSYHIVRAAKANPVDSLRYE